MEENIQGYRDLCPLKWDWKYYGVFIPKKRRKTLLEQIRRQRRDIFDALARQKECQILEGHLMAEYVHMCIPIPPKYAVASVVGFLKGKSAIAIAREVCGNGALVVAGRDELYH